MIGFTIARFYILQTQDNTNQAKYRGWEELLGVEISPRQILSSAIPNQEGKQPLPSSASVATDNDVSRFYYLARPDIFFLQLTAMYYNEPCSPLFTRNALESRELNRSYNSNTFSTSKRSSITHKPSIQPLKKRTTSTLMNKENAECTFQPKINEDCKNKRSIEKFIRDQENFQKAKELKIQQLRQEINRNEEESMTGTPHLDRMSRQITASQRSSIRDNNPFDRLSRQRSPSHAAPEEYLFSPKILSRSKSIVRKADVGSLLYDDAKRRQEKEQFVIESQRKQIDMMMSPKINKNTNALVLKRINTEFNELVTDEDINPLIALSVLEEIFNVDLNPNKNSSSNQLVQKIVALLAEQQNFGTMQSQKLREFITIIVMGPTESKFFSSEEEQYILEHFQYFYKERMTRERKSPTPEKLTFRPKTLASSNRLANSFREKTCQQLENFLETQKINIQVKDGSYTIEDLFLIEHMKRQTENEKKKIEKENKELESCTFKPDVSNSKSSINLIKKKPKVTLKVVNKNKNVLKTEYTQADTESMSMSKIYPTRNREDKQRKRKQRQACNGSMSENVKDVEKTVLRMSIGRQKREFSQIILQRGYPKNENWTEYQREMHLKSIENNKKLKGFTNK